MLNNAICVPWLVHDLVRVRRTNHSLIVEELHQRGGRTGYDVHFRLGTSEREALALCDEWAATGCAVEGVAWSGAAVSTS